MDVKDKATPVTESEIAAVKLSRFYKVIPNEGSTARDFLSNERTFLAWVRSSLTSIALGVALVRIVGTNPLVIATGFYFVLIGLLCCFYGMMRFRQVKNRLMKKEFVTDEFGPLVMTTVILIGAFLALFVVLSSIPDVFNLPSWPE